MSVTITPFIVAGIITFLGQVLEYAVMLLPMKVKQLASVGGGGGGGGKTNSADPTRELATNSFPRVVPE